MALLSCSQADGVAEKPMANDLRYTGGCFCGLVRYEAVGKAANLSFCHCTSCRRATGATPVAWGTFSMQDFSIVNGQLAEWRSSPKVTRGFCANCGTSLTYRHDKRPAEIDVTLLSLDDPTVLVPEVHIWVEDKLPWIVIGDGRPQFDKFQSSIPVNSTPGV
jgi:hypothetical protein